MNTEIYHFSDIYFGLSQVFVRIINLETGEDSTLNIDEKKQLEKMYPYFKNSQDVKAIEQLLVLYAT